MGEWQDISTAPRDGLVIVYNKHRGVEVREADGDWWRLCSDPRTQQVTSITHWMPLPAPPVAEAMGDRPPHLSTEAPAKVEDAPEGREG